MGKKNGGVTGGMCRISGGMLGVADRFSPYVVDLISLGLRIWAGLVFFKSGMLKIQDMETTKYLFEEVHPIPMFLYWGEPLNPEIAAIMGTGFELVLPILLLVGLGTRIAALMLLVMTSVIQFGVPDNSNIDHFIWALALGAILIQGAGRFSWDFFIRSRFCGTSARGDSDDTVLGTVISAIMVVLLSIVAVHEVLSINTDMTPWYESWDFFWKGDWLRNNS